MQLSQSLKPIDYLVIGHITQDITPEGKRIGGSAAYAARTALSMGLRVGIYTSWGEEIETDLFDEISIYNPEKKHSTTFENIDNINGRTQIISQVAATLEYYQIPQVWRDTPIVHLAPVAQEIPPNIIKYFPNSRILVTPQGWMRTWDEDGKVSFADWPESKWIASQADTIVISIEDIEGDESIAFGLASSTPILIITKGKQGATLYFEGQEHHIDSPKVKNIDANGAGDIFSASFFIQYNHGATILEAAKFATHFAAKSVQYAGLDIFPKREHLYQIEF